MIDKQPIAVSELALQPYTVFDPEGAILVSGQGPAQANPMTISWGTFGIMWARPIVMVMVRPTRHTWQFISAMPDFTVNWLPAELAAATRLCGTASGRDMDKWEAAGIHPVMASAVQSPAIAESVLTLECRTVYHEMVDPAKFLDPALMDMYPARDFHGLFFGEIIAAAGTDVYRLG